MAYMNSKDFFTIITINVPRRGLSNATITWQGNVTVFKDTTQDDVYRTVAKEAATAAGVALPDGEWSCTFFSMMPAVVTWED